MDVLPPDVIRYIVKNNLFEVLALFYTSKKYHGFLDYVNSELIAFKFTFDNKLKNVLESPYCNCKAKIMIKYDKEYGFLDYNITKYYKHFTPAILDKYYWKIAKYPINRYRLDAFVLTLPKTFLRQMPKTMKLIKHHNFYVKIGDYVEIENGLKFGLSMFLNTSYKDYRFDVSTFACHIKYIYSLLRKYKDEYFLGQVRALESRFYEYNNI